MQEIMRDQAAEARDILKRIQETRKHIDSAVTVDRLRESDLGSVMDDVEDLEDQTTAIQ